MGGAPRPGVGQTCPDFRKKTSKTNRVPGNLKMKLPRLFYTFNKNKSEGLCFSSPGPFSTSRILVCFYFLYSLLSASSGASRHAPTPRRPFDPACTRFLEKLFNDFYGQLILGIFEKNENLSKNLLF